MFISGFISNYKYFEDSNKSEHFYEISSSEDDNVCYYAHGESGKAVQFGTEVTLDISANIMKLGMSILPIEGPFKNRLNIINYTGFVLDCLDSDMGVYNLDNEIYLFGSGCLDLPIGSSVTLFNLHLVQMVENSWMFKLFGKSLIKSSHILVYCPAFSSYLEGSESISYDNLLMTKSNFHSLIYSNKWLKDNFETEYPGFSELDEISSLLFKLENGSQFIGHCEKCKFTDNFFELDEFRHQISSSKDLKESFHKIKSSIQDNSICNNQVLNKAIPLRKEIVFGVIKRKKQNLFDLTSSEKTIPIYCEDSNFNPKDASFVLIFNAYEIIEMIPKLRIPNSWTAKAYLWISPETKVWSPNGLIKNDINNCQYDTTVIHVKSEKGLHFFHLDPADRYYSIINDSEKDDSENIISIRHLIHESVFNQESSNSIIIPSSAIFPTLTCNFNPSESFSNGPLQVRLNDIPYLSMMHGLQFFSIKLRTYSISSLSLKLICSKCKSQIESGKCLGHFNSFVPAIIISAVIEAADMSGTSCSILIDQFSLFDKIYCINSVNKDNLLNLLISSGCLKLDSSHFSFKAKIYENTESFLASLIPRVSKIIICTFAMNTTNLVLKPINLEICDPKLEISNLLKLF